MDVLGVDDGKRISNLPVLHVLIGTGISYVATYGRRISLTVRTSRQTNSFNY